MKKYIQLTAGWGPAECARAVTLVSSGLLKTFSVVCLIESRPHNMTPYSNIPMQHVDVIDNQKLIF